MEIFTIYGVSAYGFFAIDRWYLILVLPSLVLALLAQFWVKASFHRYEKVEAASRVNAADVARRILKSNGIFDVQVSRVAGSLSDHYSPKEKVLRLSQSCFDSSSVAAIGVAAHEAGHAIQDKEGWLPNRWRAALFPVARLGSSAGPYLAIAGLAAQLRVLFIAGILLYTAAVLFYLLTLPVEFNASRRAMRILSDDGILNDEELKAVKKVLSAAAFTYVASAVTAFASLLRLILISRERR